MILEELIEKLNKLVEEDNESLKLDVLVMGDYAAIGDIDYIKVDDSLEQKIIIISTDLFSG